MNHKTTITHHTRIPWIDTAKGIGIFLVVLGHNYIPPPIFGYFYTFHMPLFFFLSGFLFHPGKYTKLSDYIARKFKTLIIPYILFAIAGLVYALLFINKFWLESFDLQQHLIKPGLNTFIGINLNIVSIPLWFIPCLFLTEIIFFTLHKHLKVSWKLIIGIIATSLIGLSLTYLSRKMYWSLNTAFIAVIFYGAGFFIRNLIKNNKFSLQDKMNNHSLLLFCVLGLAINFFFYKINGAPDMFDNDYHNFLYYVLGALAGIDAYIIISNFINKFLPKFKILNFLGQHSLIILGLHLIVLDFVRDMARFHGPLINLFVPTGPSLLFGLIYTISTLLLLWPIILLIDKKFFLNHLAKRKFLKIFSID